MDDDRPAGVSSGRGEAGVNGRYGPFFGSEDSSEGDDDGGRSGEAGQSGETASAVPMETDDKTFSVPSLIVGGDDDSDDPLQDVIKDRKRSKRRLVSDDGEDGDQDVKGEEGSGGATDEQRESPKKRQCVGSPEEEENGSKNVPEMKTMTTERSSCCSVAMEEEEDGTQRTTGKNGYQILLENLPENVADINPENENTSQKLSASVPSTESSATTTTTALNDAPPDGKKARNENAEKTPLNPIPYELPTAEQAEWQRGLGSLLEATCELAERFSAADAIGGVCLARGLDGAGTPPAQGGEHLVTVSGRPWPRRDPRIISG